MLAKCGSHGEGPRAAISKVARQHRGGHNSKHVLRISGRAEPNQGLGSIDYRERGCRGRGLSCKLGTVIPLLPSASRRPVTYTWNTYSMDYFRILCLITAEILVANLGKENVSAFRFPLPSKKQRMGGRSRDAWLAPQMPASTFEAPYPTIHLRDSTSWLGLRSPITPPITTCHSV